MRSSMFVVLAISLAGAPAIAGSGSGTGSDRGKQPLLTSRQAETVVRSHQDAIEGCYLAYGVRGTHPIALMQVGIVVSRNGKARVSEVTRKFRPVAPAVTSCVERVVARMRFPRSRAVTRVVVPFFFLQVQAAVAAGPFPSCWRARGC